MSARKIPFGPLAIWLAAQCLALALSASRVSLSNAFVQPTERVAIEQLLLVQIIAASLLFPVLLSNVSATIVAIAATAPFLMLGRMLAAEENDRAVIAAGLYLALWIIALALAGSAAKTMRGQLMISAAALLLALGGPIVWYLHAEFKLENAAINWRTHGVLGPIMGAWAVLQYPLMKRAWAFVGASVLAGGVATILRRALDRRAKMKREAKTG